MEKDEAKEQLAIYIHNLALMTNDLAEYLLSLKNSNITYNEKMDEEVTKIQDAIINLDSLKEEG